MCPSVFVISLQSIPFSLVSPNLVEWYFALARLAESGHMTPTWGNSFAVIWKTYLMMPLAEMPSGMSSLMGRWYHMSSRKETNIVHLSISWDGSFTHSGATYSQKGRNGVQKHCSRKGWVILYGTFMSKTSFMGTLENLSIRWEFQKWSQWRRPDL